MIVERFPWKNKPHKTQARIDCLPLCRRSEFPGGFEVSEDGVKRAFVN